MPLDWSRLFPAGDFRWHLGLGPGDARTFFAATADQTALLAERARWLAESPEEYALLTTNGAPLLAEALDLAKSWGPTPEENSLPALGRAWEPDFVLLSLTGDHGPIVEGGSVCFPTSWALREKLGRSLMETHGPVPRLNAELATRISTALRKLAPGASWERDNWGLVRTPDLNRHPSLNRPRLDATVTPDEVWLRAEHQLLFRLPQTGGILFGIRLTHIPLRDLMADPNARAALHQALESMPSDAADYKGLTTVRPNLLHWLSKTLPPSSL
jgi:hypothetical protein